MVVCGYACSVVHGYACVFVSVCVSVGCGVVCVSVCRCVCSHRVGMGLSAGRDVCVVVRLSSHGLAWPGRVVHRTCVRLSALLRSKRRGGHSGMTGPDRGARGLDGLSGGSEGLVGSVTRRGSGLSGGFCDCR